MLLQRLIADPEIGFNYDYMGAAEYEFGATAQARFNIAEAFDRDQLASRKIDFIECIGPNELPPVKVIAIGRGAELDEIGPVAKIHVTKGPFHTRYPDVVAWMRVSPYDEKAPPLLLIRADIDDPLGRGDRFIEDALSVIQRGR